MRARFVLVTRQLSAHPAGKAWERSSKAELRLWSTSLLLITNDTSVCRLICAAIGAPTKLWIKEKSGHYHNHKMSFLTIQLKRGSNIPSLAHRGSVGRLQVVKMISGYMSVLLIPIKGMAFLAPTLDNAYPFFALVGPTYFVLWWLVSAF